jgi:hypothetical protein
MKTKLLAISLLLFTSQVFSANLDEYKGLFTTKLDGKYSIVVKADYENQSMTAVVINNSSGETFCLPSACNYTN